MLFICNSCDIGEKIIRGMNSWHGEYSLLTYRNWFNFDKAMTAFGTNPKDVYRHIAIWR